MIDRNRMSCRYRKRKYRHFNLVLTEVKRQTFQLTLNRNRKYRNWSVIWTDTETDNDIFAETENLQSLQATRFKFGSTRLLLSLELLHYQPKNERTNEQTNERTNEQMNKLTNEQKKEHTKKERKNKWRNITKKQTN
jgi:hypothetical protein